VRVGQAEWWAEFKIFEDRDGNYYWQLQAASGRIIAISGQAYQQVLVRAGGELAPRKREPDHGLRLHRRVAPGSGTWIRIMAVFHASSHRDRGSLLIICEPAGLGSVLTKAPSGILMTPTGTAGRPGAGYPYGLPARSDQSATSGSSLPAVMRVRSSGWRFVRVAPGRTRRFAP